jgi:CubicO group peptidase (beta-lactamase class C family)
MTHCFFPVPRSLALYRPHNLRPGLLALGLGLVQAAACAAAVTVATVADPASLNPTSTAPQQPTVPPDLTTRLRGIDTSLDKLFAAQLSPGMAVAIVAHGRIVYHRGFGCADAACRQPVQPDSLFYIASTTKAFTAFAAAALAQRGVVDLDTPVKPLMPGLRLHADIDADAVTLANLFSHTHGLAGDGPVAWKSAYSGDYKDTASLLDELDQHGPAAQGRAFAYSNIGPIVGSAVLETVTGRRWQQLVADEALMPLGLKHTHTTLAGMPPGQPVTGFELSVDGFVPATPRKSDRTLHASGGMFSSADDLAAWVGVHMGRGEWMSRRVFAADLIDASLRQRAVQNKDAGPVRRTGWALGWDIGQLHGQTLYHRPGAFSGYASHVSFMPQQQLGLVVLSNGGAAGNLLVNAVVEHVYAELLRLGEHEAISARVLDQVRQAGEGLPTRLRAAAQQRAARHAPLPLPPQAYAGRYAGPLGTMMWQAEGAQLSVRMGALVSDAEVFDARTHALRVELTGRGEVMRFQVTDGLVQGLQYAGGTYRRMP